MPEATVAAPESFPHTAGEVAGPGRVDSWSGLLERFYRRACRPLPRIEKLKGSELPEPCRTLLVHSNDMTPTLESYYGQALDLTVLSRERRPDAYLREVTLDLTRDRRPVEYGAIRIYLDHFDPVPRRRILDEEAPLGKILETEAIPHVGWPQAFFRLSADEHVSEHLRLPQRCELFGRRNVLLDGQRRMLAEVIEVLAPSDRRGRA